MILRSPEYRNYRLPRTSPLIHILKNSTRDSTSCRPLSSRRRFPPIPHLHKIGMIRRNSNNRKCRSYFVHFSTVRPDPTAPASLPARCTFAPRPGRFGEVRSRRLRRRGAPRQCNAGPVARAWRATGRLLLRAGGSRTCHIAPLGRRPRGVHISVGGGDPKLCG
jgi:hypothetical protein